MIVVFNFRCKTNAQSLVKRCSRKRQRLKLLSDSRLNCLPVRSTSCDCHVTNKSCILCLSVQVKLVLLREHLVQVVNLECPSQVSELTVNISSARPLVFDKRSGPYI